jgi:2-dehydropantoate 2-reductase
MRVLIIGCGVNGALAGAALVERGGVEVSFLTRPARQRQLMTTGLHITSPLGRFRKPVHAVAPPKKLGDPLDVRGPFDVLILATRANVYQPALFLGRDVITPETMLVPLYDGVHHLNHWRECYPSNPVAIARFDARATQDADGVVHQHGPLGDLKLGMISKHGAERLEALCIALDGRRFRVKPDAETVLADVWARAIYRAAAAGACRLSGMPLRDSLRFASRKPFEAMLAEGIRAGEERGVRKLYEAIRRYRDGFQREGEPINAPVPIEAGGRAGSEALFLLANLLRQCQDAKVPAPMLMRAWDKQSVCSQAVADGKLNPSDVA